LSESISLAGFAASETELAPGYQGIGNHNAVDSHQTFIAGYTLLYMSVDVNEFSGCWPQVQPPQWDLISTCRVDGRPGLLLVEAKAHEGECSTAGKELEQDASPESERNHGQIRRCLRQAQEGLRPFGVFRLSVKSHYQLANRLAYLWKLASLGIPAVLLYLGFIGDTYFERDCLVDANHWQRVMGAYMHNVVPLSFPGRMIQLADGGHAQMIIKSLPVLEVSSY
jgi:hypothetical protein